MRGRRSVSLARAILRYGALGAVAAGASVALAQQAPAPDELSPVQILLRMERTYRNCRSYRDSGDVRSSGVTDGGRFSTERPFATVFVRPGRFRFEFTDTGLGDRSSKYIVWVDGDTLRSWWDAKPGVRRPESLQQALDVASGISGGSSLRVPGMLMPEVVGSGPLLVAPERIDDADDRGVACLRVRGKSRATPYTINMGERLLNVKDESITLWIDRATFLLRKVEQDRTYDTYRERTTTTYTPELDVEIPASQLAFGAPGTPAAQ